MTKNKTEEVVVIMRVRPLTEELGKGNPRSVVEISIQAPDCETSHHLSVEFVSLTRRSSGLMLANALETALEKFKAENAVKSTSTEE